MVLVRHPHNRKKCIRLNDKYDQQDFIVSNAQAQDKTFKDLPYRQQLTQNNATIASKTREDAALDYTLIPGKVITKNQIYGGQHKPEKYRDQR